MLGLLHVLGPIKGKIAAMHFKRFILVKKYFGVRGTLRSSE